MAAGLLGYVVLVYVLLVSTPLRLLDALFFAALIELLPAFALVQVDLVEDLPVERVRVYVTSAMTILLLGAGSLALGSRLVGLDGMGVQLGAGPAVGPGVRLDPGGLAYAMSWGGVTFILGVGTLWTFLMLRRATGWRESRLVRELMPVTGREKRWFTGLSICAGFGEELAYRGYAIPAMIVAGASAPLAVALTSAAFAVLHSYQGVLGVVRTGLIGVIMGVVFLHTGSVWPPIIGHVAVDVVVGLVLADKLLA